MPFSTRYSIPNLISSTSTGMMFGVLFILIINELVKKIKIKQLDRIKIPQEIISIIIATILGIIFASIIVGPNFIVSTSQNLLEHTINPLDTTRFGLTVAENQKPDFTGEWTNSFGPTILNIPLYFWMFFAGAIFLFYEMIKHFSKKERILLCFGYLVFLICLIFSNYSAQSVFNGESFLSKLVYFGGLIILLAISIKIYWERYNKKSLEVLEAIDFGYLVYFIIFTMSIIGARGASRLIMVLASVTPIVVAYLIYRIIELSFKEKEDLTKTILIIFAIAICLAGIFSFYAYYENTKYNAENFAPNIYTQQWQKAMSWVRENTNENTTVFAHWWDYGYWVQSIGKRATILDGGNAITYWNYLMGRHVLTGTSEQEALEFLYPHNATHLLIDSTDIGKYTAFSSIGSDENYDRFSWISTFMIDETQTQELKNETTYVYPGTVLVDEDILINQNGKTTLIPRKKAYLIGVLIKVNETIFTQAEGIYYYNGLQYRVPLKYLHISGSNQTIEFENGIDAGAFIYPQYSNNEINPIGAMFYLSNRTINSNLIRMYLFGEESNYFKLEYSEDDYVISALKSQGYNLGDFIEYSGFRGPIKIWNISYPKEIKYNLEYLQTDYPNINVKIAKSGEY
jgi:asparagine N-glycosylation enzyme membrane subunit Stt3